MTLYLYSGTPGSGKSLHMAKDIYWHLKMHRAVICNFEINTQLFKDCDSFFYVPNDELNPERVMQICKEWFKDHKFKEGAISLYIDEAQTIFNSRADWKTQERSNWVKFFTQHRKLGLNVYVIAQMHEMIDKQIRSLTEYEVHHRKVNNVGWFGKCVSLVMLGHPVTCAVTKWYGQRMRLGAEWFIGTSKYYRLYDTFKIFEI